MISVPVEFRSVRHFSSRDEDTPIKRNTCAEIGRQVIQKVIEEEKRTGRSLEFSNFFIATTCPDRLAPSLGQTLQSYFPEILGHVPAHDMVQGCAGAITSMCLAAELVSLKKTKCIFISVDTATNGVSSRSPLRSRVSDGAFACVIDGTSPTQKGLIRHKTLQYNDSRDVVIVNMGHMAREIVEQNYFNPQGLEDGLTLQFDERIANKMIRNSSHFAKEFFKSGETADFYIVHQASSNIVRKIREDLFNNSPGVLDFTKEVGNCGVASIGVVLSKNWEIAQGKTVFLCSFGTGGVISGSYWQF